MTVRFTALSVFICALLLTVLPVSSRAQTPPALLNFQVPAGPLENALNTLGQQAGVVLVFSPELTKGLDSAPLRGSFSLQQALRQLLEGKGIQFNIAGNTVNLSRAETGDGVMLLQPVRVIGTQPKRYQANTVRSAYGIDRPIADIARSIQVIPEQVILDQHAQDLRDVLKNVSGVQSRNISGGTTDAFILRGFEVQNILRDGFQIDRNSQRIQTSNIERVEVVKGANAILTGQSQPGGTINIVTKKPQAQARRVVSTTFDEFGRKELVLDFTGGLNENKSLLYRLVAEWEDSDIFRKTDEKAQIKRNVIAPSLTWQINNANRVTASVEYTDSELPFDEGIVAIPDANGRLRIADIDRAVRLGEKEDISDSTQITGSIEFESQLDDNWTLTTSATYQSGDVDSFSNAPVRLLPGNVLLRRQQRFEPQIDRLLFSAQVDGEFDFAGSRHEVVAGLDYNRREFESEGSFDSTTMNTISVFNPVYNQVPSNLVPVTLADFEDKQTGLYIQDLITLGQKWKLSLGLRVDQFEREGFFRFAGNVNDRALEQKTEVSPNVGVIVDVAEYLSFYTSYSESYDPNNPSTNIVTGETVTVDPSEGEQYEIGLKASAWEDKMTVNVAYFDITRSNIPFGRNPVTNVSLLNGEEHSQGVEIDANVQFANGLNVIANYAYIDAQVSEGSRKGNEPRNVPEHSANLWLTYEFTKGRFNGLGVGGGASYTGERYVDANNTFELDSYTTLDATIFYYLPITKQSQMRFQLSVRNLTDEDVFMPNSNVLGIGVGAPRTVLASVGYEF